MPRGGEESLKAGQVPAKSNKIALGGPDENRERKRTQTELPTLTDASQRLESEARGRIMLSAGEWGRQGEGRGGQKAMPSHHRGAGGARCVLCAAAHRSVYCRLVLVSMVGLISPLPTL